MSFFGTCPRYMEDRRGRIQLHPRVFGDPWLYAQIMRGCIVTHVNWRFDLSPDFVEYHVVCADLPEIAHGEMMPWYTVEVTPEGERVFTLLPGLDDLV